MLLLPEFFCLVLTTLLVAVGMTHYMYFNKMLQTCLGMSIIVIRGFILNSQISASGFKLGKLHHVQFATCFFYENSSIYHLCVLNVNLSVKTIIFDNSGIMTRHKIYIYFGKPSTCVLHNVWVSFCDCHCCVIWWRLMTVLYSKSGLYLLVLLPVLVD